MDSTWIDAQMENLAPLYYEISQVLPDVKMEAFTTAYSHHNTSNRVVIRVYTGLGWFSIPSSDVWQRLVSIFKAMNIEKALQVPFKNDKIDIKSLYKHIKSVFPDVYLEMIFEDHFDEDGKNAWTSKHYVRLHHGHKSTKIGYIDDDYIDIRGEQDWLALVETFAPLAK